MGGANSRAGLAAAGHSSTSRTVASGLLNEESGRAGLPWDVRSRRVSGSGGGLDEPGVSVNGTSLKAGGWLLSPWRSSHSLLVDRAAHCPALTGLKSQSAIPRFSPFAGLHDAGWKPS